MKRCPRCNRTYTDATLNFCLDDGEWLRAGGGTDEPATAILSSEAPTKMSVPKASALNDSIASASRPNDKNIGKQNSLLAGGAVALAIVLVGVGYVIYRWTA